MQKSEGLKSPGLFVVCDSFDSGFLFFFEALGATAFYCHFVHAVGAAAAGRRTR